MRERELSDNLMVYQKQDEIKILQDRISSQQEKLGGLDVNNLHTELQEKEAKKERYIKEVCDLHTCFLKCGGGGEDYLVICIILCVNILVSRRIIIINNNNLSECNTSDMKNPTSSLRFSILFEYFPASHII